MFNDCEKFIITYFSIYKTSVKLTRTVYLKNLATLNLESYVMVQFLKKT